MNMQLQDKLQLIIITFNRSTQLNNTLQQLCNDDSPVKNFDILILDNNSTDNTHNIVIEWQNKFKNINYIKNKYNVGGCGNIFKAFEIADKEYLWILGDDDKFDFSNWEEVETAILNKEKLICISRYLLPDDKISHIPALCVQLTFITGAIYSTSLLTDTTMRNIIDSVYTLFPHMAVVFSYINNNGNIYVVKKAIAINSLDFAHTDSSYTRGCSNKLELNARSRSISWAIGYANVCNCINNKKLRHDIFVYGVIAVINNFSNLVSSTISSYFYGNHYLPCLMDVINVLSVNERKVFEPYINKAINLY